MGILGINSKWHFSGTRSEGSGGQLSLFVTGFFFFTDNPIYP
jgi:hypothetical protein